MRINYANTALSPGQITGAKIADGTIKTKVFTGRNGAGNITVSGLAVGDRIQSVVNLTDGSDATADFTTPVGTANTLAQSSASDYSAKKFVLTAIIAAA